MVDFVGFSQRNETNTYLSKNRYLSFENKTLVYKLIPILSFSFILSLWFIISTFTTLGEVFLPAPQKVLLKLLADITNPNILEYIKITLTEAGLGSCLGAFLGLLLAYMVYKSKILDRIFHPFIAMSQSVPAIAIAPLLVLWVGYGLFSIVILCTLIVFFPIFIATLTGFKTTDKNIIEAAKLDGATGLKLFSEIEFPLSLPSIIAGFRNGFTLSITGAIVGEIVMGGNGLGTLLTIYRNNLDIVGMFSTIIILCLLSLGIYEVLLFLERKSKTIQSVINKI